MNQQATMGFIKLLVLGLVLAGFSALATSTIKAQSTQVRVNVTPENFGTYFDVDANGVATLNLVYANDHILSFGPGEYPYSIRVQTASNVVLRGTNARNPAQASRIKAGQIIEGVDDSNDNAVIAVTGSTDVTFDGFEIDFSCVHDPNPGGGRLFGVFFADTSGTISNNRVNGFATVPTIGETTTCDGRDGVAGDTSLRHIIARTNSGYAPTIDASGKVTNLMPVSITGNEMKNDLERGNLPRFGIMVQGFINATVTDNRIQKTNTGIQVTGGASGLVAGNTISHVGSGIEFAPNWFVPNSPDGETIESHLEIRDNEIYLASLAAIGLGFGWCASSDGTTTNTNAKIIGNYIHTHPPGTNPGAVQVASCRGSEDERIKADIIGNTFSAVPAGDEPLGLAIFAAPSFNSGTSAEAWFELNVKYNEFTNYLVPARITNLNRGARYGVAHAKVDATHNYWGTGAGSPQELIEDVIEDPSVAEITYVPWLKNTVLSGRDGPFGRRTRELPETLPSFSLSPQELTIQENHAASFEVRLDAAPTNDVRIDLDSDNPDLSFSPNSVVFTPANWESLHKVTVAAARDDDVNDETSYIAATSVADGGTVSIRAQIIDAKLQAHDRINKLEPSVEEVSLSGGDSIRLSIIPYGRQNIVDDALIDGKVGVTWSLEGGTGDFRESDPGLDADNDANDREIIFTAPTNPGTYMVHATLKTCGLNVSVDCRASFTVHVLRRASRPTETTPEPRNPAGSIPMILTDSDGNQYEVFTPEGGGTFTGDNSSLKAGPGVVPNGEIVGLRIAEGGSASNDGKTYQRYSLGGSWYEISAVDASGNSVSSYVMNDAVEVCIPLPDALRSNISDLALVAINADDSLTILSGRVRISASAGTKVCGNLSSVPATVAVGTAGSPAPLPTEVPVMENELPDTGGAAPSSNRALVWLLIIGLAVVVSSYVILRAARRRTNHMR